MATQRKQRQTSAYIPPSHLAHEYNKAAEGSLEEKRRGEERDGRKWKTVDVNAVKVVR